MLAAVVGVVADVVVVVEIAASVGKKWLVPMLGLVQLNGSSNLLCDTAFSLSFLLSATVCLQVPIGPAKSAHGEFMAGDASDPDFFTGPCPAYRPAIRGQITLVCHQQPEFSVVPEARFELVLGESCDHVCEVHCHFVVVSGVVM